MSIIDILLHIAAAVLGYVIGSVNAAVIITKYILKSDVRERGSKNAGAANVTRVFGPVAGGCTLLLDMAKVMFVMWLGGVIAGETGTATAAIACLTGHCFPIFFGFKGGKGILCSDTLLLLLDWRIALVGWGVFVVLWLTTRYVSLGSVAAAVSLPFTTYFVFHNTACTVLGTCISLLVLWAHRSNIKRLLSGTESKFHFHVNAPKPGEDE